MCIFACVMNNRPISGGGAARLIIGASARNTFTRTKGCTVQRNGARESQQAQGIGHAEPHRTARSVNSYFGVAAETKTNVVAVDDSNDELFISLRLCADFSRFLYRPTPTR